MAIHRLLYLGTMQHPDDCARNPWCSEAMNVTQLMLMRAFRACGVARITGLSIPGTSSWHSPQRIQRAKQVTLDPGITIQELPSLALGPFQPLSQAAACGWALMRQHERPDAILINNPLTRLVVPALLAGRVWRVPVVIIAADLTPRIATRNPLRALQNFLRTTMTRIAPGVVVFSGLLARDLRPERPWVRMVRPPAPDVLEPSDLTPDRSIRVAYYAGAMAEVAGAGLFLEAIQQIQDPAYRFWFSGRGPLDATIHQAAEQDSRITHWGFVSREKYHELLYSATILINPRLSSLPENRYNFPSKLMEYMAVGRPIISTSTADVAEYYADALVLLDDETPERLAELIQRVCTMPPDEHHTLGQRARHYAESATWEAQARLILDFMTSLKGC